MVCTYVGSKTQTLNKAAQPAVEKTSVRRVEFFFFFLFFIKMPFDKRVLFSTENMAQPHTPESSEQDIQQHAPQWEDDDPVDEWDEANDAGLNPEDEEDEEEPPKVLRRSKAKVGFKTPMKRPREEDDEDLDEVEEERDIGDGDIEDIPDLRTYFAFFKGFPEIEQVKMCRSYATYLSSRTPKNRMRFRLSKK